MWSLGDVEIYISSHKKLDVSYSFSSLGNKDVYILNKRTGEYVACCGKGSGKELELGDLYFKGVFFDEHIYGKVLEFLGRGLFSFHFVCDGDGFFLYEMVVEGLVVDFLKSIDDWSKVIEFEVYSKRARQEALLRFSRGLMGFFRKELLDYLFIMVDGVSLSKIFYWVVLQNIDRYRLFFTGKRVVEVKFGSDCVDDVLNLLKHKDSFDNFIKALQLFSKVVVEEGG